MTVPAFATSSATSSASPPHSNAGEESQAAAQAEDWFMSQRLAPNGAVDPNAYASAAAQAAALPTVGGAWTERTNLPGADGNDFSDSPQYIDPTSNFSNSGAGDRWVAGRMTALAAAPDGSLFAGGADGGVWKSADSGQHWTPVTDTEATLSIGALLVTSSGNGYTVYAGTGEANTSSDSYAGVGVLASTDGGSTWQRVGGPELNGALIFRLAQDGSTLLAATSHGLYSFDTASSTNWTPVLQPAGPPSDGKNFNLVVGNMITDVVVRPGTGGKQVVAVAGWRGGAPTNGLYVSSDGGAHFSFLANPQGWVPAKAEGRTTLAYSSAGDRAYAIVQSPYLLNVGTNGHTLLQGVYESANGDPNGPWTKIADSSKLASSGSAQFIPRIGTGYQPGVQAWYNQFLAVDPANKDHLYLGLEEVYETQNGGSSWNTIAPYWNFGFKCFSYTPFEGTCNHNQAHSDQHAAIIAGGKLYVGNDGGVYARALTDHAVGDWTDLNQHLDALQYYGAQGSGDSVIYGGLQDNGSNKVFTTPTSVLDDNGKPINVSSVQVFGGDGGYTIVDPANSKDVITEYTGLTALKSTDGGANWQFIVPPDPDPRFIAPIDMDRTNSSHLVAGGAIVWNSEAGIAGTTSGTGATTDWQPVFDVRTALGGNAASQVTALDAVTISGTQYVAAAWCGPCNPSFSTGSGFRSGIVMLSNSGGSWHATAQVCTGTSAACVASGLPGRYISGVKIDTANPSHAYLSLSGYSRKWMIGPDDPGVGHVFETSNGGTSWTNVSGNLPDAPTDDVVYEAGHLVVGSDFGVFVSKNDGAAWSRVGTNLPNVVVGQLTVDPHGTLVAATHGRGIWTITAP
ncbi:MAG TPA: sialidase family protein [Trebonia sp.]